MVCVGLWKGRDVWVEAAASRVWLGRLGAAVPPGGLRPFYPRCGLAQRRAEACGGCFWGRPSMGWVAEVAPG